MAYVTYSDYTGIYGTAGLTETDFSRLGWDAERFVDKQTTGIDGIRKLYVAYPTDEYTAEAVMRCICKLINTMYQVEVQQNMMALTSVNNGARGGVIGSMSSGSESISYNYNVQSDIQAAATDPTARTKLYTEIVKDGLSGLTDLYGVHLLWMGRYPYDIDEE